MDRTVPTVSIVLATGSLASTSVNVHLLTAASDLGSGIKTINLGAGSSGTAIGSTFTPTRSGLTGTPGSISSDHSLGGAIAFADDLELVLTSGDGAKHLDVLVSDQLGNTTTKPIDLILDTTPPATGSVTINGGLTGTNNVSVPVTIFGSDGTGVVSGVAQMGIQTVEGNSPNVNSATWIPYANNATVTLNPVTQGVAQYIFVWFKDNVGLVSAVPASAHLTFSNAAPTATLTRTSSALTSSNLVNLSFTATESTGLSTITSIEFSNDGVTWVPFTPLTPSVSVSGTKTGWDLGLGSANGLRTVSMRAKDASGNPVIKIVTVTYDNSPPVISSLSVSGTGGTASTRLPGVTVSMTLSDNLTSTGSLTYQISEDAGTYSGPIAAGTKGTSLAYSLVGAANASHAIHIKATDQAGNVSTVASRTIVYDTAAPTISAAPFHQWRGNVRYIQLRHTDAHRRLTT